MGCEFVLLLLLAALGAMAVLGGLLVALALASCVLLQPLMELLRQLYGQDRNPARECGKATQGAGAR